MPIAAPTLATEQLRTALADARNLATLLAERKEQGQPLEVVGAAADLNIISGAVDLVQAYLSDYNTALVMVTAQIATFKAALAADDPAAIQAKIRELELAIARQSAGAVKAVADYQSADTTRKQLDQDKTNARTQFDTLLVATLKQYENQINRLLVTFGADFTIAVHEAHLPRNRGTSYGVLLTAPQL